MTDAPVPLLVYIDQRFADHDRAVAAALVSLYRATDKADEATTRRFESVNAFRSVLSDQQRTFLSRQEYEANHHNLEGRIAALEAFRYERSGTEKAGIRNTTLIIAIVGLFLSAGLLLLQYHLGGK